MLVLTLIPLLCFNFIAKSAVAGKTKTYIIETEDVVGGKSKASLIQTIDFLDKMFLILNDKDAF